MALQIYDDLETKLRIASDNDDAEQIKKVIAEIDHELSEGNIDNLDRSQLLDIITN